MSVAIGSAELSSVRFEAVQSALDMPEGSAVEAEDTPVAAAVAVPLVGGRTTGGAGAAPECMMARRFGSGAAVEKSVVSPCAVVKTLTGATPRFPSAAFTPTA